MLKSLDTEGMFDPESGLLTRVSFLRDLNSIRVEASDRSLPLSVARFSFNAGADKRESLDAARLMTRLIRNIDFATRDEDGAILIAFTQTDLRSTHVIARRLAGALKGAMLTRQRAGGRLTANVAWLRPNRRRLRLLQKELVMAAQQPVRIDVVSDVVCPWCFIGKRRLEKAIALNPEIPVEVHWRPYFLNDWIPREGISREQYLTTKFGSPERYKGIAQRVAAAASAEGLTYAMDKISRQPNTLDAHRLIRWAERAGKAAEMKQRLMDLYFTEGADLTNHAVLAQAAADIGLDADNIRQALASDQGVAEIEREALSAKEAGIEGVPCFIFGGKFAVSGAQAPEYLAEAIARAAQTADAAE